MTDESARRAGRLDPERRGAASTPSERPFEDGAWESLAKRSAWPAEEASDQNRQRARFRERSPENGGRP